MVVEAAERLALCLAYVFAERFVLDRVDRCSDFVDRFDSVVARKYRQCVRFALPRPAEQF